MTKTQELRKARRVSPKLARALRGLHKPGDCPAWEAYPLSTDKGDPPGTRIKNGEKWSPSKDPAHKPCTMCHKTHGCYEPWTPDNGGGGGTSHDPDKTPLATFPRWPVAYMQEAQVGTASIGKVKVLKRWEEPPVLGRPMSKVFLDARGFTAVRWIALAELHVDGKPQRKKWIARLRRELIAKKPMQEDCTIDCRAKYRHLWLIANAAQYLAGRFSGGAKIKPPYIAPPESILKQVADWAGNKITEAVDTKLGYWLGGGLAVGLAVLVVSKISARPKGR